MELNQTWLDPLVFDAIEIDFELMAHLAATNKMWRAYIAEKIENRLNNEISTKLPFVSNDGSVAFETDYVIQLNMLHLVPGRLLKALELLDRLIQSKRCPKNFGELFDERLFASNKIERDEEEAISTLNTIHFLLLMAKELSRGNHFIQICVITVILGYITFNPKGAQAVLNPHKKLSKALLDYTDDIIHWSKNKRCHHLLDSHIQKYANVVKGLITNTDE